MTFPQAGEVRTLISAERIAARVAELGRSISQEYAGRSVVLVSILKGSFVFVADLVRAIELPVRIEFLGVRSYGANTKSSGVVEITQDLTRPIEGDDVIVVEDIVDTGLTLTYIQSLLAGRNAASVKVCALLHKPSRSRVPVTIDYLGFTVEDVFIVGYGLDHAERYRNLPMLAELNSGD
jgi:hypoxanthine phosphoribosyltransferase